MKNIKLKNTLAGKVLLGLIIFGIILSTAVSAVVVYTLRNTVYSVSGEGTMADELGILYELDQAKLKNYILTNEADDYYYDFLDMIKFKAYNSGYIFIYIIYWQDDHQVYVFDSGKYGVEEGSSLGDIESRHVNDPASLEYVHSAFYEDMFLYDISSFDDYKSIATYYCPIYDDDGSIMAYLGADIDMQAYDAEIRAHVVKIALICIGIVFAGIIIFYFVFKKRFTEPIELLKKEVQETANKLDSGETINLNIKTGDEIEDLSHVFENMYVAIQFYMEDVAAAAAEREHIEAELSIATEIQASLLPRDFPERPEFGICATMTPAKEVGGDFYDFFMLDDSHLAFVVADVSGKGVPAALFMVVAKTLIKDHTNSESTPDEVFNRVNDILVESDERGMFVTAFEGILDLKTGEIVFVNAGHEPPFIRSSEGYREFKPDPGIVLSCMPGVKYKFGTLKLEEGDALFQYTDGVTEATDSDNELYGFDRLEAVLNANTDKSASELLPAIKADIDAFVGSAPQFDDITMLCLEFKKKMKDK